MESTRIQELKNLFEVTINKINKFLGKKAFSVYQKDTDSWYTASNRALYDAEMLAFADVDEEDIVVTPEQFQEGLKTLMENVEFKKSLNEQAGGKKIAMRVEGVKAILTETNAAISS